MTGSENSLLKPGTFPCPESARHVVDALDVVKVVVAKIKMPTPSLLLSTCCLEWLRT